MLLQVVGGKKETLMKTESTTLARQREMLWEERDQR